MDFAFTDEQEMLREQARSFLTQRLGPDKVVEVVEGDRNGAAVLWPEVAELGWIGLSAPEDAGGAGMSFLDEAVLFEEMGRALYPGPYFATVALALPALARDAGVLERVVSGHASATLAWVEPHGPAELPVVEARTHASDNDAGAQVRGEKRLVPDAALVDLFVVAAQSSRGPALYLIERAADGVTVKTTSTMDASRPYGHLSLMNASAATLVASGDPAREVMTRIRARALAAAALEAVGVAQRALELAREHVAEREQFGKPIGTYQAVSHQVADIYMHTELARSLAYWAAWCVAENDPQQDRAVASAKSYATEAAVLACERAIQVHGGIGFTWEHFLHRLYKRAQWLDSFGGFGARHRSALAAQLLDA